jgi:hypothetical protein
MRNRWLTIVLSVAAGFTLESSIPYRSDLVWIDSVTGSGRVQIKYFLVPVSTTTQRSALEHWVIAREGHYQNNWQFLSDTSTFLLSGRSHGCGLSPEIYEFHAGEVNDWFVRTAGEEATAAFVKVMRSGTPDEKKQAVDAELKKLLER